MSDKKKDNVQVKPLKTLGVYRMKNGRYYNTDSKKVMSMKSLFAAVKEGVKVTVLDKETSKDITQETLIKCLHQNFIQNKDRIVLKDIEETIQTLDDAYSILDEVGSQ